jgi:hypothetical protein
VLDLKEAQVFPHQFGGGMIFSANLHANGQGTLQVRPGLPIATPELEKNA